MCGLFGVMGEGILSRDLDIFKELGIVNQLRGMDGSGVYQVNTRNKKKAGIFFKIAEPFSDWLVYNTALKNPLARDASMDLIMGHTRAATRGSVNDDNAHPFNFNRIIGFHNGTMKTKRFIDETQQHTDSELFLEELDTTDDDEQVLKNLDPNVDDHYTVIYYDKGRRETVFIMNGKRPLNFFLNDARNVLYWSSEKAALDYIVRGRYGLTGASFSLAPGIWKTSTSRIKSKAAEIFYGKSLESIIPKKEVPVNFTIVGGNTLGTRHVPRIVAPTESKPHKHTQCGTFGVKATCCNRILMPLEQYKMRCGETGWYDDSADQFFCYSCDSTDLPDIKIETTVDSTTIN